ncbi:hypothetical protein PWT90_06814 [Aphanocladium album]|nr:hypothetical protein PWT90_06814 [Aphanocladium album]
MWPVKIATALVVMVDSSLLLAWAVSAPTSYTFTTTPTVTLTNSAQPLTSIKTPGHRKRRAAETLIELHRTKIPTPEPVPSPHPIRVVCIADTNCRLPAVPDGDILIHAGDLTENGSSTEIQDKLKWLSALPHKHKIFVAGNHDVLLDDTLLAKYPERRYNETRTRHDLNWGNVFHRQNGGVTIGFPASRLGLGDDDALGSGSLTIFGSPWTPKYGVSAFQYHLSDCRKWEEVFGSLQQRPIVVTHGPPKHHLDKRDFHQAGYPYLAQDVRRLRPKLAVFGHIHASYGREEILFDTAQELYKDILAGWAGWGGVLWLSLVVLWSREV